MYDRQSSENRVVLLLRNYVSGSGRRSRTSIIHPQPPSSVFVSVGRPLYWLRYDFQLEVRVFPRGSKSLTRDVCSTNLFSPFTSILLENFEILIFFFLFFATQVFNIIYRRTRG